MFIKIVLDEVKNDRGTFKEIVRLMSQSWFFAVPMIYALFDPLTDIKALIPLPDQVQALDEALTVITINSFLKFNPILVHPSENVNHCLEP